MHATPYIHLAPPYNIVTGSIVVFFVTKLVRPTNSIFLYRYFVYGLVSSLILYLYYENADLIDDMTDMLSDSNDYEKTGSFK